MDLWYTTTSPFARKVRIAAAELGLDDRVTLVRIDPWTDDRLRRLNPLCKVPTVVLDDGAVLFESAIICEWLDTLGAGRRLIPDHGVQRWQALGLQGVADGAMAAAGRLFADERRPADERAEPVMARLAAARDAALDWLERQPLQIDLGIGDVAVAACLGYLDFRWPDRCWRQTRPRLSAWMEAISSRPSIAATRHR
jgi:glutathione S-transferase